MDTLSRLARASGGVVPARPLLLAEIDGEVVAARSLRDGARLANDDPIAQDVLDLLAFRARQLRRVTGGRPITASGR